MSNRIYDFKILESEDRLRSEYIINHLMEGLQYTTEQLITYFNEWCSNCHVKNEVCLIDDTGAKIYVFPKNKYILLEKNKEFNCIMLDLLKYDKNKYIVNTSIKMYKNKEILK